MKNKLRLSEIICCDCCSDQNDADELKELVKEIESIYQEGFSFDDFDVVGEKDNFSLTSSHYIFLMDLGVDFVFKQKYFDIFFSFTEQDLMLQNWKNLLISNLTILSNILDQKLRPIPLAVVQLLSSYHHRESIQELEICVEQLKALSETDMNDAHLAKTCHFIISLCCCETLDKDSLIHSCNSFLKSSLFCLCIV